MRRRFASFACIGFLFGLFQLTGRELARQGNIIWNGTYTWGILLGSLLIALSVGLAACFLPRAVGQITRGLSRLTRWERLPRFMQLLRFMPSKQREDSHVGERGGSKVGSIWVWLISAGLIALCWLPAYLAYYPGICAYDVTVQTGQIENHAYNDHHPIAHTLLLEGSMRLGAAVFGDSNTGLACLVLLQMLCLAAALAWGIALLYRRGVGKGFLLCLQAIGMFYPFHWYMSVSVSKDIFFTVFFMIQVISLCETLRRGKTAFDRYDGLFIVSGVGMQLFRTNGRYAMLVLAVFLCAALALGRGRRRFWGKLCIGCAVSLLVGSLSLSALFRVTGAEQGDRREMLSLPIQQFARCMLYHGGVGELPEDDGTMEAQDKELIDAFLLDEGYREYRPEISDPVKRHTNTYVARYRAGDFVRTYLHLLTQYPGDFINAGLAVNAGYLYIGDESHALINQNGIDKGLGYVQTRWVNDELNPRGLYQASKWETLHGWLESWADKNAYLRLPVIRYLFVPGTFLWLYLLLAGRLIERKCYARCIPLTLILGYYLTLLLGPTVQLRYIYPLMTVLPYMALMLLTGERDGSK
ncbi:MAG: DUF6020 family protein [Butyrivibrio sp.]|nr:DUF6020 family protein [Muribaculum sp.]MCM1551833.1 DUF6020 family protein [Butyrivibrio sp.]